MSRLKFLFFTNSLAQNTRMVAPENHDIFFDQKITTIQKFDFSQATDNTQNFSVVVDDTIGRCSVNKEISLSSKIINKTDVNLKITSYQFYTEHDKPNLFVFAAFVDMNLNLRGLKFKLLIVSNFMNSFWRYFSL